MEPNHRRVSSTAMEQLGGTYGFHLPETSTETSRESQDIRGGHGQEAQSCPGSEEPSEGVEEGSWRKPRACEQLNLHSGEVARA